MRKNKTYTWLTLLIVLGYLLYQVLSGSALFTNKKDASLISCVDGDTMVLMIENKSEKVRLLAVDTPERNQPYYRVASDFTCNLLKDSTTLQIEMDKNATYDSYERLLAWVWVDDELLQSRLVGYGLAKVAYLYDEYKYTSQLQNIQQQAKFKKINLWSLPNP